MDTYRKSLFSAGYSGAYSFPVSSPLAWVSQPFTGEELKELAANIRLLTRKKDDKIQSAGAGLISHPILGSILGVYLDFIPDESIFPLTARSKIVQIPQAAALYAAVIGTGGSSANESYRTIDAPVLSFRAASVANMTIHPLGAGEKDYSFEWQAGPAIWLPGRSSKHIQVGITPA